MEKRYNKYRPVESIWLREVPEHWEFLKFKYKLNYTTGFTPPTKKDEYYNGDITWVTITDMKGKYVEDSETKLTISAIEDFKPTISPKGSLLFSFKLSVGKVAFANADFYTNEAILTICPDESIDLRYFYYTLPEQLLQNANENIYGAKILNQEVIRNAFITFPPLQEQIKIADYLDKRIDDIDSLVNRNELVFGASDRKTGLIQEYKNALIHKIVTGKISIL